MQAVAKLFHLRQLSVYLRRENIPALLQLAVLEQESDTLYGERLPDFSSISANRYDTFTDEDLCGAVKVGNSVPVSNAAYGICSVVSVLHALRD